MGKVKAASFAKTHPPSRVFGKVPALEFGGLPALQGGTCKAGWPIAREGRKGYGG